VPVTVMTMRLGLRERSTVQLFDAAEQKKPDETHHMMGMLGIEKGLLSKFYDLFPSFHNFTSFLINYYQLSILGSVKQQLHRFLFYNSDLLVSCVIAMTPKSTNDI
jgi:hypothetical protein